MKIFFSAPISSLKCQEEKQLLYTTIDLIVEDLQKLYPSNQIYYSPHNTFDSEIDTVLSDIDNIKLCDIFILIYPKNTGTSSLFETGIAYANNKKLLFFKQQDVQLPFMLKHLPNKTLIDYNDFIDLKAKVQTTLLKSYKELS